jgi:hypothetical protein
MNSILPIDEIKGRFDKPLRLEQEGMDRYDDVAARDPNGLLSAALTVWQRHIRRNPTTDAGAARDYIRQHGGDFLGAVQAIIGSPVIRDISYSRVTIDDESIEDRLVAYLLIARVYPNELHIADMNFIDPYKPIRPEHRRYKFQKYKGLRLLGCMLARAEKYAVDHECTYLTLNAATDDLVPLFAKFGFTVEDGQATSLAMEKKVVR